MMRTRHARQIRSGILLARDVWDLLLYLPASFISTDTSRLPRLEAMALIRESRAINHRRQRERALEFSDDEPDDTQRSHRRSLPQPDQERKNGRPENDN